MENKSEYDQKISITRAYVTKRECYIQETVSLLMPELQLCRAFLQSTIWF